ADESRWARLLGQFVRVHSGADMAAVAQRHDLATARQLFVLDLRDAEAALLARDAPRYRAALTEARGELQNDFDATAAAVAAAAGSVDALASLELTPPPPGALGAALKELRNLRATHALREPARAAAAPKTAEDRP